MLIVMFFFPTLLEFVFNPGNRSRGDFVVIHLEAKLEEGCKF